MTPLIND